MAGAGGWGEGRCYCKRARRDRVITKNEFHRRPDVDICDVTVAEDCVSP